MCVAVKELNMKAKRRTGTLQVTQSPAGQEQISRGTGAGRTDGLCSPPAEPGEYHNPADLYDWKTPRCLKKGILPPWKM